MEARALVARLYQPAWYRSCSRVWNDSHQCVCSASTLRRRLCRFEPDRTNSASDRLEGNLRAAVASGCHASSNPDAHPGHANACPGNRRADARLDCPDGYHPEFDHDTPAKSARHNDAATHESGRAADKSSPDAGDQSSPDDRDKSGPDAGAGLTAGCRSGGNRDVDDYYGDTCPKAVGPRASATL